MIALKRFEKTNGYFKTIECEIISDIEASRFKQTLLCAYRKTKIIDSILQSLIKISDDKYSSQILFRSLIEHYLLTFYCFLRAKIENSDEVGIAFYDSYANSEFFKQETYSLQLDDIRKNIARTVDISILKGKYPELQDLTQLDLQRYHEVAAIFSDVKKIGRYLINNANHEPFLAPVNLQTFNLLERYNLLSSFVHGGPYAERVMFDSTEVDAKSYEDQEYVHWGYTLSQFAKIFLVLALRNEFGEKYDIHFKAMYK